MPEWVVHSIDETISRNFCEALLIPSLQARLFVTRGIKKVEDAVRFLSPSLDDLHDPFLFDEMERATEVLRKAITGGERILIHGDYDADGVCGTALLYEGLRELGADVYYFIPDRAKDGYGLSMRVMERGVGTGLDLVVSVDCGSSDRDVVSYLLKNSVDVIITDHHETRERIHGVGAFINPKLPGESYPFKELSGTGVAFKLLQGLEKLMRVNLSLKDKMDLVAVGTLGDYMILRDENRVFVRLGLEFLKEWKRPGFRALRMESNLPKQRFSARQVCFTLVPRLNSPGRIGSARDVVQLLLTDDFDEASRLASEIEKKNMQRRAQDNRVTEEACYLADIVLKRTEPRALVFSSSSWHEGVVGISAARLAEKYYLPSVLIAVKDGIGKGSARSAGVVNIKETLERCSVYLKEYGGHREAGGFSILEKNIPDFQIMFEEAVTELSEGISSGDSLHVDADIRLSDCGMELIEFIERLAPFGPGNHEPLFLVRGLKVLPGSRIVGDGHLKLSVRDTDNSIGELIGFSLGRTWNPKDIVGSNLDVLLHLRRNIYMGKEKSQLQMKAIRFAEGGVHA